MRATMGCNLWSGEHVFLNNCPINEMTGDGVLVGRCWHYCKDGICPRHGDVSVYLKQLPKLTAENEMRADRGLPLLGKERFK
jgi:hypothetical protein